MDIIGQVVSGGFAEILIRQKHAQKIELGELLVADYEGGYSILQVYNLKYGSQIPQSTRELMSGLQLEKVNVDMETMEPQLRNYILVYAKSLVNVGVSEKGKTPKIPKDLPEFFTGLRRIEIADLDFLQEAEKPVYVGKIRSGSRVLDIDVTLPGDKIFSHHILIPATTGRGKSNLVKVFTFKNLSETYCGMLLIDPHDEYYGVKGKGLSNHSEASTYLKYYSPRASLPPGGISLAVHVKELRPWHLNVFSWSDAQTDALYSYYNADRLKWVENIVTGVDLTSKGVKLGTLEVLRRKFRNYLGLDWDENNNLITSRSIFKVDAGDSTINDITGFLEEGMKVIVDTSILSESTELILNTMIVQRIFDNYKGYKADGKLEEKPVIAIILEEAPRVIGQKVMGEDNIFGTIAREGRKFKIGLVAITQLPSEIPREVLANMNTKIILGNEMGPERRAIIDSASQDLSTDDRTIASLDTGEAIISSNFTKFAVPIMIPLFDDILKDAPKKLKKAIPGAK